MAVLGRPVSIPRSVWAGVALLRGPFIRWGRAGRMGAGGRLEGQPRNPSDPGGPLIAASKVNGTNVLSSEKLGSIYDVILAKGSGKAEYAIMSFGGFLGIGEQYHPLPWNVLSFSPEHDGYVVDLDRSRLEGAMDGCSAGFRSAATRAGSSTSTRLAGPPPRAFGALGALTSYGATTWKPRVWMGRATVGGAVAAACYVVITAGNYRTFFSGLPLA